MYAQVSCFVYFMHFYELFSFAFFLFFQIGRGYDATGELVPGKVSSFWKGFFYPMNGTERHHTKYEILVTDNPGKFKWEAFTGCKFLDVNSF